MMEGRLLMTVRPRELRRPSRFRRLALSVFVVVTAVVAQLPAIAPAYAAGGSHTITVVETGGTSETADPAIWSTSAGGVITATGNVSINASDIVSKLASQNVTIDAATIVINHSVVSATGSSLTLKATGNITVSPGVTIQTNNGDITLQSDSDASGNGAILVGNRERSRAFLTSQGGDIVLSGGLDPSTGYAMAVTGFTGTNAAGVVPSPAAGLAIFESTLDAGGGRIVLRSKSDLSGFTSRGMLIERGLSTGSTTELNATNTELVTDGAGSISIEAVGSAEDSPVSNPIGITMSGVNLRTVNGAINLTGESRETKTGPFTSGRHTKRGIDLYDIIFVSGSGSIELVDRSARFADYDNLRVRGNVSFTTTTGNVTVRSDKLDFSTPNLTIEADNVSFRPFGDDNFTATVVLLGTIDLTKVKSLDIGRPDNSSDINVNTAVTVGGPVTIHGSSIALNKAVTASSSTVSLHASTAVTQSTDVVDKLTADKLALYGAGTFTLQNAANNVATLAGGSSGSPLGSVKYTDASGGLTIGTVNPTGLYSTGDIDIATLSGDLLVTQPVVSTKTSGDTVKLFAAKNESAGTAGDGDVKISGSGSVTVDADARALIYSGTRATSTGLVTVAGGNSNTRAPVASGTDLSSLSPSIPATGKFALFRVDDTFVEESESPEGGNTGGATSPKKDVTTEPAKTTEPTRSSVARVPGRAVVPPQEVAVEQVDVFENPVATAPAPLPMTEVAEVALTEPENSGFGWVIYWVAVLFVLVAFALFYFLWLRRRKA
jgi:hypothetical protein